MQFPSFPSLPILARRACLAACAIALLSAGPLRAAQPQPPLPQKGRVLSIGLASAITSLDPHYHVLTPNQNIAEHVFDTLIARDPAQRLKPALALAWKALAPDTWEFRLRPGVKFHDGSDFSAEDVKFSLERPAQVGRSPSSFTIYTRSIAAVRVADPLTIVVRTHAPNPLLPAEIATIAIVSRLQARNATTEDFNTGRATVGTGPFRLVAWNRGDRVELRRNDDYWGAVPAWESVVFHLLPNSAARSAALLSGGVQAIEQVPTADLAHLRARRDIRVVHAVSNRIMYLHLDSDRERTPQVRAADGGVLERNPLKDPRVRLAISKAINRAALCTRVMEGMAVPAGQLMPEGFSGFDQNLPPEAYDPAGARRLLAQAGYPEGFRLTLHASSDRYINDREAALAIAQMLTRAGIRTEVAALPSSVYFSRATQREFSVMLFGWSADTAELSSPLRALLATYDSARGLGSSNRGRYSNPAFDQLLGRALASSDERSREILLKQATRLAIGDLGIIPLYHPVNTWALRGALGYTPRSDERTYAQDMRPR